MSETKSLEKILFIRLDKIGDLVCTLPCDEHPLIPKNVETFWILSKGNEFIALNSDPPRSFLSLDKKTPWQSFKALSTFLRQHRFDAVFFISVSMVGPFGSLEFFDSTSFWSVKPMALLFVFK
jgi:ADP-heptose:LPS heptosyltransferase